eukprot:1302505-Prymnesium_polylepis.1
MVLKLSKYLYGIWATRSLSMGNIWTYWPRLPACGTKTNERSRPAMGRDVEIWQVELCATWYMKALQNCGLTSQQT